MYKFPYRFGLSVVGLLAVSCVSQVPHKRHKPIEEPVAPASPEVASPSTTPVPAAPPATLPTVPATAPSAQESPALTPPAEPKPEPVPSTQPASEPATGPTPLPTSAPTPLPTSAPVVPTIPATLAATTEPTTGPTTQPTTRPSPAPATRPAADAKSLFNGKDLTGWTATDFAGHGEPRVEDGAILVPQGENLSGVSYSGTTPHVNYEVDLDAQRVAGTDFFCGLTVPVKDSHASLIVGGWGGGVCGISSIDGNDAARNDTTTVHRFEKGKWYHIRLRVLADRLQAWIDDDQIVDTETKGHQISVRAEVEPSRPFGISTYQTTALIKNVTIKPLTPKEIADAETEK